MNKDFNSLPRDWLRTYRVKPKYNLNTNLDNITNSKEPITDGSFEYYTSRFQFSDFHKKNINPPDWDKKPYYNPLQNYKFNFNLEFLVTHLVSQYKDLDTCLSRLYQGYHDSCFIRFALKAGVFTTEEHWENLLRNWYLGFSMALRRYYNSCHPKYDLSAGISYNAYFDLHFSNYLYYAIGRADQDGTHPTQDYIEKEQEVVKLGQLLDTKHDIIYTPYLN